MMNLMKLSNNFIAHPVAFAFLGGVVAPIMITNWISKRNPNMIYRGKDNGELDKVRSNLSNFNSRIANIETLIQTRNSRN